MGMETVQAASALALFLVDEIPNGNGNQGEEWEIDNGKPGRRDTQWEWKLIKGKRGALR